MWVSFCGALARIFLNGTSTKWPPPKKDPTPHRCVGLFWNRCRRRQCRRLFSSFKPKKFEFEFCVVLNVLGGWKGEEPGVGSRGQVPTETQVSAAEDHLGRRGDHLLLQGEIPRRSQRLLQAKSLPDSRRETHPGQKDGTDADPSLQLVQKPTPTRPDPTPTTEKVCVMPAGPFPMVFPMMDRWHTSV